MTVILDYDDENYDEWWEDERDYETTCEEITRNGICGEPATDICQCCGKLLCHMHREIGGGFCRGCPTKECIDENSFD